MKLALIEIENFRCIKYISWEVEKGINVLVGENDAGKTAVVDAIHLALGSVAQESTSKLGLDDFREGETQLRVTCKFVDIKADTNKYIEYLSYEKNGDITMPCMYLTMHAEITNDTRWPIKSKFVCSKPVDVMDGSASIKKISKGKSFEVEVRDFFKITYLKPLRDAERELSARRGSRLSLLVSQLLSMENSTKVRLENKIDLFEKEVGIELSSFTNRSNTNEGHGKILKNLIALVLEKEKENTNVMLGFGAEHKIKNLLERLDLSFYENGKMTTRGLGYSNLLFIATELSLLESGLKVLIIEEPEAHLHPQLQVRLMKHLEGVDDIQVILTTHSPNISSKVKMDNLNIVSCGDIFPLGEGFVKLNGDDRGFLERFLDVTKANMFFARGVMLVEGDSEELLIPTIAELLGRDMTDNGVSIVKVGSKAAARYAKVFLRTDSKLLNTKVAVVTDKDVIPKKMKDIHPDYDKKDAGTIENINEGAVRTFVSTHWTLEYDLALGDGKGRSLALEILQAFFLLQNDDDYMKNGCELYEGMKKEYNNDWEKIASQIMYIFELGTQKLKFNKLVRRAKPEMAQALSLVLKNSYGGANNPRQVFSGCIPKYIIEAIDYLVK
ncbi:MAG TPA: AAA family ATPase [Trichococcus sp.]|nr:AAA family ATPase [Trichococcus sp.]